MHPMAQRVAAAAVDDPVPSGSGFEAECGKKGVIDRSCPK